MNIGEVIAAIALALSMVTGIWHISSAIAKITAAMALLQKMLEGNTTMTHSTLERVATMSERVARLEGKVGSDPRHFRVGDTRRD
jgi:uncharacterized protein YoxC